MPTGTMRCAGIALSRAPSNSRSPDAGGSMPEMTRISVVLPAPFGPMTPTASPAFTSRLIP
jgi:hypothetical protein